MPVWLSYVTCLLSRSNRRPRSSPRCFQPNDPPSILIEDLAPVVSGGRHRVKRCVGDSVTVSAAIFCAGHDLLGAAVRYRHRAPGRWREAPLEQTGAERFEGVFTVSKPGYWGWQVVAWIRPLRDMARRARAEAGRRQDDVASELAEGATAAARACRTRRRRRP